MKPLGAEVAEIKANKAADEKASVKLDMSKVKVEPLFEDMVDFDTSVSYTHLRAHETN